MTEQKQREVTLEELQAAKQRGDVQFLKKVKAQGTITVRDKDGNVKSELEITSIDFSEEM